GGLLYERVAKLAQTWNEKNNVEMGVGDTHNAATQRVRAVVAAWWSFAPGVGAQGVVLEPTLKYGWRRDGKGLLLPISRAISRANNPAKAAAELRDEILYFKHGLRK